MEGGNANLFNTMIDDGGFHTSQGSLEYEAIPGFAKATFNLCKHSGITNVWFYSSEAHEKI